MKLLGSILLILMLASIAIIVAVLIYYLVRAFVEDFLLPPTPTYPKIKFSQFKKFYDINQNRWVLCDEYVICWLQSGQDEYFSFNFFDFHLKYKPFIKHLEKVQKNERDNATYLNMIAAVKQDIADFEQRNAEEVNSKINEIWSEVK